VIIFPIIAVMVLIEVRRSAKRSMRPSGLNSSLPGTDAGWMSELLSIHGCSHICWMAEVNCWMH